MDATNAAFAHFFPDGTPQRHAAVYIAKALGNVTVKATDGNLYMSREQLLDAGARGGNLLYGLNVLRPVLSRPTVPEKVASSLVLEVMFPDSEGGLSAAPPPLAISTSFDSNRVAILASAIGHTYKGASGGSFKVLDAALRARDGGEGLFQETLGRWGINVEALPKGSRLVLRSCPFPCKDGEYVVQLKFWTIVKTSAPL